MRLMARVAELVRWRIEQNGGRYDGRQAPNIQSIIDCATVDERHLVAAEDQVAALELEAGLRPQG